LQPIIVAELPLLIRGGEARCGGARRLMQMKIPGTEQSEQSGND